MIKDKDNRYTGEAVLEAVKILNAIHSKDANLKCDLVADILQELHKDLLQSDVIKNNIDCAASLKLSKGDGGSMIDITLYGSSEDIKVTAEAFTKYELIRQAFVSMGGDVNSVINPRSMGKKH